MSYVCLKCGNVTEVLAEGGHCPRCGAIIATQRREKSFRNYMLERMYKQEFREVEPSISVSSDFSPETGNLCLGLFGAAIVAYPLGIFLPLATISKHMTATEAINTADKTGTGGFLTDLARDLFDFFGENPTIVDESNTFSLVSGLGELLSHGQLFLFIVILLFSILFPVAKLLSLGYIAFYDADEATRKRQLKWLSSFGKWSMLDVFVIALLVVSLKLGDMVNVEIHSGIYFFVASVILTMILTQILHKSCPVSSK
ncbi:MAG: hypothetical protein E7037_05285 [Verrucomicrobia bacterium]|nr:hypothetical protein [Verrucomicrobiota bacterium]